MNEALMKHVERAVRPLHIRWERKLAMREELLAHLTAIYEEELLRSGDEQAALAQATARFGEPDLLTQELKHAEGPWQRTAFAFERFLSFVERMFAPRPHESLTRFAWRFLLVLLFFMSAILVIAGVLFDLDPTLKSDTTRLPVAARALLLLASGTTVFQVAIHATLHQPKQYYHLRAAAIATIACALIIALASAFWWSITFDPSEWLTMLPRVASTISVVLPAMILSCVWLAEKERPRLEAHQQWQTLELDS